MWKTCEGAVLSQVTSAPEDAMAKDETRADSLAPLFPGKSVDLTVGDITVTAVVYPLGFKHLRRFSREVTGALLAIVGTSVPKDLDKDKQAAFGGRVMMQLIPYAIDNLLDLVKECVVFKEKGVTIDDMPHWHVATLVELWAIESFGEEKKWRPWLAAVENVHAQVTGKKKTISEIFSSSSSSPAIVAPTS